MGTGYPGSTFFEEMGIKPQQRYNEGFTEEEYLNFKKELLNKLKEDLENQNDSLPKDKSNKLKGNVPWNKGLTKEDDRVKKYIKNHKHEEFLKIYELNAPNNIILIFNGKQKLENYIKSVNKNLKFKNKINIDNLIKNKIDKGYTIEIKKIIE